MHSKLNDNSCANGYLEEVQLKGMILVPIVNECLYSKRID